MIAITFDNKDNPALTCCIGQDGFFVSKVSPTPVELIAKTGNLPEPRLRVAITL